MSKLTAAIIEDEVPAARLLSSIITRLRPDWEVTVLPGSVEEAIVWFRTHSHPDILFLDIQLSDGNSFDFLSAAQPSSLIIFTTAYDQYAIRAFTVNSIDYILKPVDDLSLTRLEEQLDPRRFFRANRQVIVCIDAIVHAAPYFNGRIILHVKPIHKDKITVSEEKVSSFKMWLNF